MNDDVLACAAMDGLRDYLTRVLPRVPEDPGQDLFATGILDSLGVIEVASLLEEAYELTFEPEDFTAEHFSSLERILQIVEQVRRRRQG